jgi:cytochrome oxidase Cu insertion factor (SCO1/SenC/PrrC family)
MKRMILAFALVGCASSKPPAPTPETPPATPEAKKAPDFTLDDTDGKPVTLSALLKDGPVILAFFPKAFTGG